jgi:hypothetical protein
MDLLDWSGSVMRALRGIFQLSPCVVVATCLTLATVPYPALSQEELAYRSPYLDVSFSAQHPALVSLRVDALGGGRFGENPVRAVAGAPETYESLRVPAEGLAAEYRRAGTAAVASWRLEAVDRTLRLVSRWDASRDPAPLVVEFDPRRGHPTLLGHACADGSIRLPAMLHLPDQGSVRFTAAAGADIALGYDARRAGDGYVRITFPAATPVQRVLEYTGEVVAIHPSIPPLEGDPRFAALRRNWLNILQWNPRLRVLANHAASDTCAFCLYEYADIALHTPPLADGLTALDLIRASLDRYLDGLPGYGLPGYVMFDHPSEPSHDPPFLDSYPSLLIAAAQYVQGTGDAVWLNGRYAGLRAWTEIMLAMDRDGNGLLEYPYSGNSGSWSGRAEKRPSNWWDCIGFGHEDAYANALAYRALRGMQVLAQRAGQADDARRYAAAADRLKATYCDVFYNPATGVLAGWRSADGELHDYYFLFVTGIAICYDLVPRDRAHAMMDRLLEKLQEVGYRRFDLGLPGNLVVVPRKDYVHQDRRWGGGEREDNADGFQIYENGGATACFAYFTLAALYHLDRKAEADAILLPLLQALDEGKFRGRAENGMTYDWKAWDGTPWGYEGFLVDNYYVLLAVLTREKLDRSRWMLAVPARGSPSS